MKISFFLILLLSISSLNCHQCRLYDFCTVDLIELFFFVMTQMQEYRTLNRIDFHKYFMKTRKKMCVLQQQQYIYVHKNLSHSLCYLGHYATSSPICPITFTHLFYLRLGFPGGLAGKESACNVGDLGSIPGLGRYPGEGVGYPLQYSGLENSMDQSMESERVRHY